MKKGLRQLDDSTSVRAIFRDGIDDLMKKGLRRLLACKPFAGGRDGIDDLMKKGLLHSHFVACASFVLRRNR